MPSALEDASFVQNARDNGYSDDEIYGHLAENNPAFGQMKQAGYSFPEVYQHIYDTAQRETLENRESAFGVTTPVGSELAMLSGQLSAPLSDTATSPDKLSPKMQQGAKEYFNQEGLSGLVQATSPSALSKLGADYSQSPQERIANTELMTPQEAAQSIFLKSPIEGALPRPTGTGVIPNVVRAVEENVEALPTGLNIILGAGLPGAPSALRRAISLGFGGQMAAELPAAKQAIADANTPGEKAHAISDFFIKVAMTIGAAKHGVFEGRTPGGFSGMNQEQANAAIKESDGVRTLSADTAPEMLDPVVLAHDKMLERVRNNPTDTSTAALSFIKNQLANVPDHVIAQSRLRIEEQALQPPEVAPQPTNIVPIRPPEVNPVEVPKVSEVTSPEYIAAHEKALELSDQIADQVTGGQSSSVVREAARDAAHKNAVQSIEADRANPKFNPDYMRKSAMEAAGKAAEKEGISLETPIGEDGKNISETLPSEDLSPRDAASKKEYADKVNEELDNLDDREKQALKGKHYDGLTFDEIGKQLGVSSQRAHQIYSKGIEKMRASLEQQGYTGGPGAMGPVEAMEFSAKQSPTGIRNAIVDQERIKRGLEPRVAPLRRTFGDVWDTAMRAFDKDDQVGTRLVDELSAKNRPLTDVEDAVLTHEQLTRQEDFDRAVERVNSTTDPVEKAQYQSELDKARERVFEVYDVGQRAGTANAQGLAARRLMVKEDYSLAKMEARTRAETPNWDNLSNEDRQKLLDQVKASHERIADLEKKLDEAQGKVRENDAKKYFDALVKELKSGKKEAVKKGSTVGDFLSDQAQKARARIKARGGRLSANLDPVDLLDHAIIGADYIAKGFTELKKWGAKMVRDFGPSIKPHLEDIFTKAKEFHDEQSKSFEPKKEPTPADIVKSVNPKNGLDHNTVYDLARAHVNAGVEGFENVMKAVHEDLKSQFPKITQREVNDAFSEYGQRKYPSQEADKMKLAEYRRLGQLTSAIEDARRGQRPQKTGLQRGKPTQDVREMERQLRTEMDKAGIETTSPEQQLASRNQQRASALKNQIEDLDKQLRTGEKPAEGSTVADSPEVETLRSLRDSLKSELKRIEDEANPPKSPEQKALESRIKAAEKSISDLDQKLKTGDVSPKEKAAGITNDKLDALRSERDSMQRQLKEMRDEGKKTSPDEKAADEAQKGVDAASAALDRWDRILKGEETPSKTSPKEPVTNLEEELRSQVETMKQAYREIQKSLKPEKDAEAARQKAVLQGLDRSIKEYERRVREMDFESAGKRQGPDTAKIAAAKSTRDAAKAVHDALRKASDTYAEQRLRGYKNRLVKETASLRDKISRGDYSKTTPEKLKLDAEAQKLHAERETERGKFEEGLIRQRLANRTNIEKVLEQVSGAARASALSGYHTLAKLFSYSVSKFAEKPVVEGVGAALSKIPGFRGIAEKATLESGNTLRSVAKFYSAAATKGLSEAYRVLRTGKTEAKTLYGNADHAPVRWYDFFGSLHMAEKAPLVTGEHAALIERLTENALKQGLDPRDEFVKASINKEAYDYAQRSILQENNKFAAAVNGLHARLEQVNKETGRPDTTQLVISTMLRTLLTKGIVRTPANYIAQTIARTPIGLATGILRTIGANARGLDKLTPAEANATYRLLKVGAVGSAFFLLGAIDATKKEEDRMFGGYYEPGRKKEGSDVPWGQIRIGSKTLPHLLTHNPLTESAQMGSTMMRVAMSKMRKKDPEQQGLATGAVKAIVGLAAKAPIANPLMRAGSNNGSSLAREIATGLVPQLLQNIAEDTDQSERKPKTITDSIKMTVPGLRQEVPGPEKKAAGTHHKLN